uniref:Uncharacterized protein n=1 Tax=Chrysotila carterae TaxID=13221 RepID=A0A7S4C0T1_CHRCT|eukprot:2278815-Pleurochrysis_carterae.AAC.4
MGIRVVNSAECDDQIPNMLPCEIMHTGRAPVGVYFRPEEHAENPGHFTAHFRGRRLEGAKLPLPAGYVGSVLHDSVAGSIAEGEERTWVRKTSFSSMVYWKHDDFPLHDDPIRKCMRWAELAAVLHADHATPADADAVNVDLTAADAA